MREAGAKRVPAFPCSPPSFKTFYRVPRLTSGIHNSCGARMQLVGCTLAVLLAVATSAALADRPASAADQPSYIRVQRMDQSHLRLAMSPICNTPFALRNFRNTIVGKTPFNKALTDECWLLDEHPKVEVVRMIDPMTAEIRFYTPGKWSIGYIGFYQIEEGDPDPPVTIRQSQDAKENAKDLEKYGVADLVISPQEKAKDQRYGGFPNNRLFNNETKCSQVVVLFQRPGISPADPRMAAFLRYTRVKLMEMDIAVYVLDGTPALVDQIGSEKWRMLPVLYPTFCRSHPQDTLEDATGAVLAAASIMVRK